MEKKNSQVNILFGSQLGTGEGLAKNLTHEAIQRGYDAICYDMLHYEKVIHLFSKTYYTFF